MLSADTAAALNRVMADSERPAGARTWRPHEFDHRHGDVSGGWLRAATFGAMDGLVSNTALIAGIGAAANAHAVIVGGFAGLASGAFSMALGEYTSVRTANEQIESEEVVERRAFRRHPQAEKAELVDMLIDMGMSRPTATQATEEIHRDETRAVNFHLVQEIGVNPRDKPSPYVAAISSFLMFALGAVTPLIPFLLGHESLWWGLACGGLGLMVAGGVASRFTRKSLWFAATRQLVLGAVAIAATYLVGTVVGTVIT
jgi:VIT1/CCC1 family predicted Fe2+/Mn2+ transporter